MMIRSSDEIRSWDAYTMANEPVTSVDLMERAARACHQWILESNYSDNNFRVFCGKGNNGGDGLALARLLHASGKKVNVVILEYGHKGTPDFQENLVRLHSLHLPVSFISTKENIHTVPNNEVIIDAVFGTGLDRAPDALASQVIQSINASGNTVLSIDIPSGLYADRSSRGQMVVKARHTLSFQCHKLAFLLAENEPYVGEVHILDIGLHPDFPRIHAPKYRFIDKELIAGFYKPVNDFAHKGSRGHAALMSGHTGMMGAAILSAKACLRAGAGKLTCFIPEETVPLMQVALPEAICSPIAPDDVSLNINESKFEAWGAGPAIGTSERQFHLLAQLIRSGIPKLVLDADALNILSLYPELISQLPENTILTPHVGEWERINGRSENDFQRLEQVMAFAENHHCIVALKGRYTFIADPKGRQYFNTTGNSGLAKAGTGDVLTGMITSYLAQGYSPLEAALSGVYMHGLAADRAIRTISKEALLASDVVECLGHLTLSDVI